MGRIGYGLSRISWDSQYGGLSEGDFCNLEGEFFMIKKCFSFSIPKWVCETGLSFIYIFGMILGTEDWSHLVKSLRVCIAHFLELELKVIEDSRLYIRFDIPCYDRCFVARCSRWKLKSCHPFHASRGRLLGSKLSMEEVKTPLVLVVRWDL